MQRDHLQGLHWQCFVCGPDNPKGLRLNIRLVGEHTETQWTPTAEYQGPPGITHSGVVAALLEEVMSQLLHARLIPAVTRKIEVTYRRPVRVGVTYTVRAEVAAENNRIVAMRAEIRDPGGQQVARARGIFAPLHEDQIAKFLGLERESDSGTAGQV